MTYLIIESTISDIKKVKKATPTKAIIEAVLQTADTVNGNKRIYPKDVIQQAIEAAEKRIKDKRFGGELDHPIPTSDEQYSMIRHMTPLLEKMSHYVYDLRWEGNELIGTVETTTAPNGYILAGLIYDGMKVGFSIRALSDNIQTNRDGIQVVGSPMTLIAIDAVSIPSHQEALLKEIKVLESYLHKFEKMKCTNGQCILNEHLQKQPQNKILEHYPKNIFDWR